MIMDQQNKINISLTTLENVVVSSDKEFADRLSSIKRSPELSALVFDKVISITKEKHAKPEDQAAAYNRIRGMIDLLN